MKPAEIILQQMGGSNRLKVMIGAYNFLSDNNGKTLTFRFKGSKVANYVSITLNRLDTYDVEFGTIRAGNYKVTKTYENIYNDQLKPIFEDFTKLYLSF